LTEVEIGSSDGLAKAATHRGKKALARYMVRFTPLGGYRTHANDPPPGKPLTWLGRSRMTDLTSALASLVF